MEYADFSDKEGTTGVATLDMEADSKTYNFSEFPESAENQEEVNDSSSLINTPKHPVWSFAYYQQFFNVDTSTVVENLKDSVIPLPSRHNSHKYFGGKADLYGPVWICATLVVVLSVFSNLNTVFNHWSTTESYTYTPQFERVSVAGIIVFVYCFIIPTLVYGFIRWKSGPFDFCVSDYISSYGYSMFTLVPMSMLLIIRNDALNWILILSSLLVSGGVLVLRLWNTVNHVPKQVTVMTLLMVLALHLGLLITIKLYFFTHTVITPGVQNTTAAVTTTIASNSTIDSQL